MSEEKHKPTEITSFDSTSAFWLECRKRASAETREFFESGLTFIAVPVWIIFLIYLWDFRREMDMNNIALAIPILLLPFVYGLKIRRTAYILYGEAQKKVESLSHELKELKEEKFVVTTNRARNQPSGNMMDFFVEISTHCLLGVNDCECRVLSIKFHDKPIKDDMPFTLWLLPGNAPYTRKQLLQGAPLLAWVLSIAMLPDKNLAVIHSAENKPVRANDGGDVFRERGEYEITVSIVGTRAEAITEKLKFVWNGNHETSTLEKYITNVRKDR